MESVSLCAIALWLLLHLGALTLAWATRVATGSRLEPAMQAGFFATMAVLGIAAWVGRETDIEVWPASAVTLMGMVLTAVIDFRRVGEPAPRAT
jgi:hypothetical protein